MGSGVTYLGKNSWQQTLDRVDGHGNHGKGCQSQADVAANPLWDPAEILCRHANPPSQQHDGKRQGQQSCRSASPRRMTEDSLSGCTEPMRKCSPANSRELNKIGPTARGITPATKSSFVASGVGRLPTSPETRRETKTPRRSVRRSRPRRRRAERSRGLLRPAIGSQCVQNSLAHIGKNYATKNIRAKRGVQ